jgi:hypothetical protein
VKYVGTLLSPEGAEFRPQDAFACLAGGGFACEPS